MMKKRMKALLAIGLSAIIWYAVPDVETEKNT